MSKKTRFYNVESDIASVSFDVLNADVIVRAANDSTLGLETERAVNLWIANSDGQLIIKQGKRLFTGVRKKQKIILFVPEHLIPSLSIYAKEANFAVEGGRFADLDFYAERGALELNDTVFDGVNIKGGDITMKANSITVKNSLICAIRSGETVLENCFAIHTECRNKHGNVGVVNLNCKDSLFEAEHGNVTATVLGDKKDFNLTFNVKEGTCNLQSELDKDCPNALKAFAYDGNVFVDFIQPVKEESL